MKNSKTFKTGNLGILIVQIVDQPWPMINNRDLICKAYLETYQIMGSLSYEETSLNFVGAQSFCVDQANPNESVESSV